MFCNLLWFLICLPRNPNNISLDKLYYLSSLTDLLPFNTLLLLGRQLIKNILITLKLPHGLWFLEQGVFIKLWHLHQLGFITILYAIAVNQNKLPLKSAWNRIWQFKFLFSVAVYIINDLSVHYFSKINLHLSTNFCMPLYDLHYWQ